VRSVLSTPSELFLSHRYEGKVQDAYSLRCVPQVHGIAHDTIGFVRHILNTELNSATDNPMCFTQEQVEATEAWVHSETSDTSPHSPAAIVGADVRGKESEMASGPPYPVEDATGLEQHTSLDEANREIAELRRQLSAERRSSSSTWSFYKKTSDTRRCIHGGGLILSGGNCKPPLPLHYFSQCGYQCGSQVWLTV
jgi:hypothetical protein